MTTTSATLLNSILIYSRDLVLVGVVIPYLIAHHNLITIQFDITKHKRQRVIKIFHAPS